MICRGNEARLDESATKVTTQRNLDRDGAVEGEGRRGG